MLNEHDMFRWLAKNSPNDLFSGDKLDEFCIRHGNVDEALACLSAGFSTVSDIASTLGVSKRTLQRHVLHSTGMPPTFWLGLSRAREAARSLSDAKSIVEVAAQSGYADQSHMTREFKRWFSCSPGQLKGNAELMSAVLQRGYGS